MGKARSWGWAAVCFCSPTAIDSSHSHGHPPSPAILQGVDTVACVSVNDPFVMDAWAKSVNTNGKVLMLADGSAQLTRAMGLELDLSDKGLGIRSRRYAMLLEDGVIKALRLEEGGALTVSSADDLLAAL